jgi:hypothetical protein
MTSQARIIVALLACGAAAALAAPASSLGPVIGVFESRVESVVTSPQRPPTQGELEAAPPPGSGLGD